MELIHQAQRSLCDRYGVPWVPSPDHAIVGVARNVRTALLPLNGLRHPIVGHTTGWYLWAGEVFSEEPDFFDPVCVEHLADFRPAALAFLGLPPGWRFLEAGDYLDVWYDAPLLDV